MSCNYSRHIKKEYPENLFCTILEIENYDIDEDYSKALNYVLERLPERSQRILKLRFKGKLSLVKIGHEFSVTNQRIRRIIEDSCKTLKLYKNKSYLLDGYVQAKLHEENLKVNGISLIYDLPVSTLDLTNRSINYINRASIVTVGELVKFIESRGEDWNRNIRNLGIVSRKEVEEVLKIL